MIKTPSFLTFLCTHRSVCWVLAVLFFLAFGTAVHAQVQRRFMGCSFGTRQEVVLDSVRAYGFRAVSGKNVIVIEAQEHPIHYNGVEWNYVCLNFFDNQFYAISFTSDDTQRNRADMKEDYSAMRTDFVRHFQDMMLYNLDNGLRIHDGSTGVFCHIDCVDQNGNRAEAENGTMRLFLTYTDEKIDQIKRMIEN